MALSDSNFDLVTTFLRIIKIRSGESADKPETTTMTLSSIGVVLVQGSDDEQWKTDEVLIIHFCKNGF